MVEADDEATVEEEGNATLGCLNETAEEKAEDTVGNCGCRLLGFVGDTAVPKEEERPVDRKAVTNEKYRDNENTNTTDSCAISRIDFVVGKNIIIVCLNSFFLFFFFIIIIIIVLAKIAIVSLTCLTTCFRFPPPSSFLWSFFDEGECLVINYY